MSMAERYDPYKHWPSNAVIEISLNGHAHRHRRLKDSFERAKKGQFGRTFVARQHKIPL